MAAHPGDLVPTPRLVLVRVAATLADAEELVARERPILAIQMVDLVEVIEDLLLEDR